jgi:hypothetical protein
MVNVVMLPGRRQHPAVLDNDEEATLEVDWEKESRQEGIKEPKS